MKKKYSSIIINKNTKITLTGLALLFSGLFVDSCKQISFKETVNNFKDGFNSASLNYGGNYKR